MMKLFHHDCTRLLFLFFLYLFSSSCAGAYSDSKLNEGLVGEPQASPRFRLNLSGFVSGLETTTRSRSDSSYGFNIPLEGLDIKYSSVKDLKIDIQSRLSGGVFGDFLYCLRDSNLSFGLGLELQLNQGRLGSNTSVSGLVIPLNESLHASLRWSITPQFILGTNLSSENGGSKPSNNFAYIKLGPSFGRASIDRSTSAGDVSFVANSTAIPLPVTEQKLSFHDDRSLIGLSYSLGFRRNFYEFLSCFVEFSQTLFRKVSTGDTLLTVNPSFIQATATLNRKQKTNFSSNGFKVGLGFDVLALFCNDSNTTRKKTFG